jgi:hypothetical protein
MKTQSPSQSNQEYDLPEDALKKMIQRKTDFLTGKTTARPWSEIKRRYEKR